MTDNIQKAKELISCFASGDVTKAKSLLKENYIQHNLAYGTGAEAFCGSVAYLGSAPVKTTVNTIRAFEDGDKVFMQTVYNFAGAGEQVAFDIFRFEDGLVAEHWDNLAAVAAPNPSGRTQTDGTMEITDLDKTEANRELVKNFLYDVMQGKRPEKTADYFDGDKYIQHNTSIADGLSGLGAALADMAKAGIQMIYEPSDTARTKLPCARIWCGQAHFLLRPVARGERKDRRALGCHGDDCRQSDVAEPERQVLSLQIFNFIAE